MGQRFIAARRRSMRPNSAFQRSRLAAQKSQNLYFNRVLGLGLASPATVAQIEEILRFYAEQKVKQFATELSPLAQPAEIAKWLAQRGFQQTEDSAKLWRRDALIADVATDFRIRCIGEAEAAAWVGVLGTVFRQFRSRGEWYAARVSAPGWHDYLAYADTEPAAIAAMYIQGDAAHLTDAATLAPFRRRGAQHALISRRIADGLAASCHWFTSETAAPQPGNPLVSHRNLRRVGFEIAYVRAKYMFDTRKG